MSGCGEKCGCENLTTYEPCGENLTCCEHCPDGAPCAYAIISKCRWRKNGLFLNGITPLWKECLFECKWTARRCINHDADCLTALGVPLQYDISGGDAAFLLGCGEDGEGAMGLAFPSLGDLFPPIGDAATDHGDSITQISPPVALDGSTYVATRLKFECDRIPGNPPIIPYRCGWLDWYGRDTTCGVDVDAWLNTCTAIAWQLEVTGTESATLTAYQAAAEDATVELVATYNCNDWQCIPEFAAEDKSSHGNTFIMDGDAAVGFEAYLPRKLCVVPFSSDWQTPCSSKSAACACYDPGAETACYTIVADACDSINGTVINAERNGTLPACISAPSPAPCGYFYGSTGSGTTTIHLLVYCDGSDYQYEIYCGSAASCTLICDGTATLTGTCPGATITIPTCDLGVCCPDPTIDSECCPDDLIPETIYDTIGGCHSTTVTMTWNAGTASYEGSFNCSGCTVNVTLRCDTGGGSWTVTLRSAGCIDCERNTTATVTCSPFSGSATSPAAGAGCPCCSGGVFTHSFAA